jgi:predicted aldo/keto reductase-like oxidoreductase
MRLPGTLGKIDIAKSEELFLKAIEGGINYFDTAYLYPGSEDALGQILEKHGLRNKVFIATKLPQAMCQSRADFDKYFDIQKKRLRTDHVDYYFMHAMADLAQWERLVSLGIKEWIAEKKASGEIRRVGFSFHGMRQEFTALLNAYDWDFCQIQYNYLNTTYQAGTDGLQEAARLGLPVFIMEPLLGGKLATGLPKKAEALLRQADPQRTNAAWALRWIWNQSEPTLLLSGMNSLEQLTENLRLADEARVGMIQGPEAAALNKAIDAVKESYKIPCTGCNYCMPCPQKINIPALFAAYNSSYSMGKMSGLSSYVISVGALSAEPHYASSCVKCGLCEKRCPQHIAIRDSLVSVTKRLEPFFLKPIMRLVTKIVR